MNWTFGPIRQNHAITSPHVYCGAAKTDCPCDGITIHVEESFRPVSAALDARMIEAVRFVAVHIFYANQELGFLLLSQ